MVPSTLLPFLTAVLGTPVADTHPFSVHDMLAMERISEPAVSPDGNWVAFTVRATDLEANRGRTDVWLAPISAGANEAPRRLTTHEANDWSPRWTSDGRSIVFLSTRDGSSQVWRLALDGGEPEPLTDLPLDVDNVLVFPDGKRLLVTMEVYPEHATLEETAERDAAKEENPVKARVYEKLLFRHWDAWEDGKRSHVFVCAMPEGADAKPTTSATDLTRGMDGDAPTKPFGGAEELSISPDGKEVAFATQIYTSDAAWSTDVDVYTVPADGSAAPKCVTEDNQATDNQPAYSPDGKYLAWLAMARPGYESDRSQVTVMDRSSGTKSLWAKDLDRSFGEFVWGKESWIYATADNVGNHSVYALDGKGNVHVMVEKGYSSSPRPCSGGFVFLHDTLQSPAEIKLCGSSPDQPAIRPVTQLNAEKLKAARMGAYEQFSFTGAKNEKVYGYVVKPADFTEGKRYPVAFLIHGGPQGSFGDHFHYRWNPQAYAGAGYAVVMVDFHGSTGYGQAFTDSIRGDWGGAPYEDLMKGLDHALATYAFLDKDKVAALGASYGGYMINWIAGQEGAARFRCLVNHDGNLDERLAYFDTEELWFPEWEHGLPWEDPAAYAKHNPIEYVKNWKTPMLVIHGANDYRVVDTQGMSTFTALQRRGIPSKFLHFPDENHWVLKPKNSLLWHETVIGWIDQWTKPSGGGAMPASGGN